MDNKRYAKGPLLYIQQPQVEEIQVTMQHSFRSSKAKSKDLVESEGKKDSLNEEVESKLTEVQEPDTVTEKETTVSVKEKIKEKNFREMTIDEQLIYLIDRPTYLPRLTCEIQTEKEEYQGFVLQQENDLVLIHSGSKKFELPKGEIKQIRILGF